ncbi:MAG: CPBP family intramembrane glutamic endopeptidase [Pseudomonadota bacterium]
MLQTPSSPPLNRFFEPERLAQVLKAVAFWVFFLLVLTGLRHLQLPGFGTAAAPIAGALLLAAMLILIAGLKTWGGELPESIGLRLHAKIPSQFFVGLCAGIGVVAVMMVVMVTFTSLEIHRSDHDSILAMLGISFLILFVLALMEEVAFRSYPLFKLLQAWGVRPAVYITSIAFAFYHGLAAENLLGPGVWGLFYAWMALKTDSIAMPTGFHVGLNWVQAWLGMKPKYGESIWELSLGSVGGIADAETVGLLMQLVLLLIGIVLVERLISLRSRTD